MKKAKGTSKVSGGNAQGKLFNGESFNGKSFGGKALLMALLLMFMVTSLGVTAGVAGGGSADKTLSPYFYIPGGDPRADGLPLKSTRADVDIAGVIADVRVTQLYKNEGTRPIEAIYVFPASTRAAVYAMKMTIGERVIKARIKTKADARKTYQQAKQAGKSASLLEQHRPNVFQMNVANIMPGDEIKVELSYTESLVPIDRVYEFVYPTVVGPRYTEHPAAGAPASERWTQNPYLKEGKDAPYEFDILVTMNSGLPIKDIRSTSHKVDVTYKGAKRAVISLAGTQKTGGNRDYILNYRLAGDAIESGLLLYKGDKENFFLLMLEPPKRITRAAIPGREYIFIMDVSGSMRGFPLDVSKELLRDLIGGLRPEDRFNVLLFASSSRVLSTQSLPALSANVHKAIRFIDTQRGGGGTRILSALKRALALPKTAGYSRTIVIVTDGYVSVEAETFELIRNNLGEANMFAFGIGSSVNRHIIEGMARMGMGEPYIVTKKQEARAIAGAFRKVIASPVLTDIKVEFKGLDVYDVEPPSVPDVLAERPVVVFGKWRGKAKGKVVVTGVTGREEYRAVLEVQEFAPSKKNSALKYLWARHRIATLSDFNRLAPNSDRAGEVTALGLQYNLLTAYTSFVAVDTEVRNTLGKYQTVKQPLPLPQGVPNSAVGGSYQAKQMMRKSMAASPPPSKGASSYRGNTKELARPLDSSKSPVGASVAGGDKAQIKSNLKSALKADTKSGSKPFIKSKPKTEPPATNGQANGNWFSYKDSSAMVAEEKVADADDNRAGRRALIETDAVSTEGATGNEAEMSIAREDLGKVFVKVRGDVSEKAIQQAVLKRIKELEKCFKGQAPRGALTLKIILSKTGKVKDVRRMISSINDKKVEKCVIKSIKKWSFPASGDGKGVVVTVRINFD